MCLIICANNSILWVHCATLAQNTMKYEHVSQMTSHQSTYQIPDLPPLAELETLEIYKALAAANRHLAELKGRASVIPNQGILIDTLSLQEAKASSEIENIVTTQDDLFKAEVSNRLPSFGPVKEVALYRDAMRMAWGQMKATHGIITNRSLISIFQLLKSVDGGFRSTGGTVLQSASGNVVYVPPKIPDDINRHMTALERFVNDDEICKLDPLIKMALIHHQFESIHPFPDGNGRIGRILNVLYLARTGLLDTPILYLSRYINENKAEYYLLLQGIRESDNEPDRSIAWQNWILYMLNAVSETAQTTHALVIGIRDQMAALKTGIRDGELTKMYSQDLVNNLFRHPYTRIEFIENDLGVSRNTATKYLEELAAHGFLMKHKEGRNNYYINVKLVALLSGKTS